ncbi:MAG: radical SAM family heme chaperone HemW [Sedimentisphaerales bacterium]|jgi:oxygen-independent coproporphyrinogen-3 oxidase
MSNKKANFDTRLKGQQPAGLYIHIPFCQTKCRYCGFYSEPIKNHAPQRLVSAIIRELGQYDHIEAFQTVYIGGGSPSCLSAKQLLRLIGEITSRFPKPEEFTIEVNPGQVNKSILSRLRAAGVTRISIGAQSFNPDELAFLGRRHSVADIKQAVRSAKVAGFDNIGLDLIFAIPGSTLKSCKHSLRSAIDLGVQHISAYALTYEEGTPLQKAVAAGEVKPVDEETDRQIYETTIDELEKAGFKQYEISNFAKPGFECRHNLNYWRNFPYLGIGPAAGSYWNGKRTLNIADIKKYIEAIEQGKNVTAESETPANIQIACETAVLNLRRRCGIILDEFEKQTGFDAMKLFAEPIGKYKKLGLIRTTSKRLYLTRKALPIADSVLCDFSAI